MAMFFRSRHASSGATEEQIDELLDRSVSEVIPSRESLKKLLGSGKRLRVKLGIDPTSPNIHLGRSVALLKMRDFERLGHQLVSIVGDFTGVIGDTSDKEAERPMLAKDVIDTHKKKYFTQAGKLIDIGRAESHYNSKWLQKLNYHDVGEHADQFSLSDFISRELIKKRLDEGKRVSLREVLYPLMQGYDSVAIKADVEIGGTDQRFNLLAGRTLQAHYKQAPQHVIILGPLLPGTDGRKMSSSWGNTINITDEAGDMFGKVMSIPDELIEPYFTHTTRVPISKVKELLLGHPKDAKKALAEELVRMYHGEKRARDAANDFEKTFSKGTIPHDVQNIVLVNGVRNTLVTHGVISSNSEFTRLAEQGGITIVDSGRRITDPNAEPVGKVIRIGKHRFVKIVT